MTTGYELKRSAPEAQGISSTAILEFIRLAEENIHELHSVMLLRHGNVVAEGWWSPYAPQHPHMLFSLSKSFTSTGVGLAVHEGLLSVDDFVLKFFPEDAPAEISPNLAAMRVRHLLSMSTGHAEDTTGKLFEDKDGNWARAFLAQPVVYEPGTHFLYNTGATYMLSAIVQKLSGMTLLSYLGPRLFEPLGIKDATWQTCPRGINTGGFGLNVKTEDIARFGQTYLQKGMWNGQQVIPAQWVAEATSKQVANDSESNIDWRQGYGYQFWRCRHGAYRGDGAFGQYCIVMPEQDAVLAITSGVNDMQEVLTLIWDQLLPAMSPTPLPENEAACKQLGQKLASLTLVPPLGEKHSPTAVRISGKAYAIEPNALTVSSVCFDFGKDGGTVVTTDARGEHSIIFGAHKWVQGKTDMFDGIPGAVMSSGVWTTDHTFQVTIRAYESPFFYTMVYQFEEDRVSLDGGMNVAFGQKESPKLVGKLS
jgi:hypothetical protein